MDTHGKIRYETEEEYETLRETFKRELPYRIRSHALDNWADKWAYIDGQSLAVKWGLLHSAPLERTLETALLKLTKNQDHEWVLHMSEVLGLAIRGVANTVTKVACKRIECEDCGNEDMQVRDIFRERPLCNQMIANMVNSVLFDDDPEISYAGGTNTGQITNRIQYRCRHCNDYYDGVWMEAQNQCVNCVSSVASM